MNKNHHYLFAYGSLISSEVIELVLGYVPESNPAYLEGYACYYVNEATFPGMVKDPKGKTEGLIYRDLTEHDWQRLDAYEDEFYERQLLSVTSQGKEIFSMGYVIPETSRSVLSDNFWSWSEFQQLHLENYLLRMR
ncbi:MAG: gamma-glutamylcyclotransferase family protein [Verrucomicrobiota bacterium]